MNRIMRRFLDVMGIEPTLGQRRRMSGASLGLVAVQDIQNDARFLLSDLRQIEAKLGDKARINQERERLMELVNESAEREVKYRVMIEEFRNREREAEKWQRATEGELRRMSELAKASQAIAESTQALLVTKEAELKAKTETLEELLKMVSHLQHSGGLFGITSAGDETSQEQTHRDFPSWKNPFWKSPY